MSRDCLRCGSSFVSPRATKRYCSERCRKSAEDARRSRQGYRSPAQQYQPVLRHSRPCGCCGAAFTPGNTLGLYCSRRCKDMSKPSTRGLTCAGCERPMVKGRTSLPQGEALCTDCRLLVAPENARARRLRGRQRRRAHLATVPSEPYTVAEIAARDGWDCHLCGYVIDPGLRWPDRQCASVDHVVPIVHGGADVLDNVALAHWYCNTIRGARPVPDRAALRMRLLELAV